MSLPRIDEKKLTEQDRGILNSLPDTVNLHRILGASENPSIPRSRLYRSDIPEDKIISDGSNLYHLICDTPYTMDEINNCRGRYKCRHCTRSILERIYFRPYEMTEYAYKRSDDPDSPAVPVFICDPMPYCRPECALARMPRDYRGREVFHLMYGPDVTPAHDDARLYGKDAISLEEFHASIGHTIWVQENPMVLHTVAPIIFSSTPIDQQQVPPSTRDVINAQMAIQPRCMGSAEGPSDKTTVYTIRPRSDVDSALMEIFEPVHTGGADLSDGEDDDDDVEDELEVDD